MRRLAITTIVFAAGTGLVLSSCSSGASASSGSGTVTIKMLTEAGPDQGAALAPVIAAYNKGQGKKDGVHVEQVQLSSTDVFTKEATEMSTRSDNFDVYLTGSYYINAHANSLAPLTGVDVSALSKKGLDALTVNKQLMAVPLVVSQHTLLYRKDWVGQLLHSKQDQRKFAQISQSVLGKRMTPKPPQDWTWNDYAATAAYFTQKYNQNSPSQYGTILPLKSTPFNVMYWDNVLWGEGGGWLDKSGHPALQSPAAKTAMNLYRTMYTKHIATPDSSQAQFDELQKAMQSGSVALMQQWVAGAEPLNDPKESPKTAGKVGMAPVPGHKAHVHFVGLGINKYGKNQEAAKKWLSYLVTDSAQRMFMKNGGTPADVNVLTKSDSTVMRKLGKYVREYGYVEPQVGSQAKYQVFESLGQSLSAGWVGQTSAEQSLADAQNVLQEASK